MRISCYHTFLLGCGIFGLLALWIADRPALGWQFRDVTSPHDTEAANQEDSGHGSVLQSVESDPAVAAVESPSDVAPDNADDIRPIRFNHVAAGQTTSDQLRETWGEPTKIETGEDHAIWKYKIDPFQQVDITIVDDVVTSILIFLPQPLSPADVAQEMALDDFTPVPIPDEVGRLLGQGYPERGVLFSFTDDLEEAQVTRIQLEPIAPELFALRAEYDFQRQYERNLKDLAVALRLQPGDAQAHWRRAEVLACIGQFQSALQAAEEAVRLDGDSPRYRLTRARLLAENGSHADAAKEIEDVLAQPQLSPELQAHAECLLGDLIAAGPTHRFKEAMKHHLEAIKIAVPLADERRFAVRRSAKHVLIDAHLAVALDVVKGDFQKKKEVVPKWIDRAGALVEETIAREQGDPALRLRVFRTQLAASADLDAAFNPTEVTDEAVKLGRKLIASDKDPLNQSRIEWELGCTVFEAMRVARAAGKNQLALSHANNAMALFEQSAPRRQSTPQQKYLVAQLYFLVGTIHAVQQSDHREAITWYKKAQPLLEGDLPAFAHAEAGIHGERFVSMGVSYWQNGDRETALEVTEQGLEIIQQAVKDGKTSSKSLAVPYGNLATMHRQLGNTADAKTFAALAAKLGPPKNEPKRR